MEHGDTAQLAALVGAIGAPLALLATRRALLLAGFALLAVSELAFAYALAADDLRSAAGRPVVVGALVFATAAGLALAAAFVRRPAWTPVALLAVAPFRIPVDIGDERAFLLLPLYGVLGAAVVALAWRLIRGEQPQPVAAAVALPAAAVTSLASVSLVWSRDLRAGSIALAFFFLPFAALAGVLLRSPARAWLARTLAALAVGLALVFAAIGLWQAYTKTLFFAPDLEVANAYTTFFRVTSLFKDPSLYGRSLVVAVAVLLVALWLGRIRFWPAAALVAALWLGLFFSYSQSSFVALFAVTLAVPLVLGSARTRRGLAAAAVAATLIGGAVAVVAASGDSLRDATSGRSRLVDVTTEVIRDHPLVGVGIGGQPRASAEEAKSASVRRNASHTTPLTVLAELGVLGLAAYVAFLAGAVWLLFLAVRADRPFGLGLAAVFFVLVVHSLFYSGFFEDPTTWATVALAGVVAAGTATVAQAFERLRAAARRRPRPRVGPLTPLRKVLIAAAALLLLAAGGVAAYLVRATDRPEGHLDTSFQGVSYEGPETQPPPETKPKPRKRRGGIPPPAKRCWPTFGGNAQRTLARLDIHLGKPTRHFWVRGLKSYIEYPPSYCDGTLYVNTYRGDTFAISAYNGKVIWRRRSRGFTPSTPAIAGPRLIVSSTDGTVTALARADGRRLWRMHTGAKVESSPAVIGRTVYFGATNGRVYALAVTTGRIRWAYDTGGRINASPSIYRNRLCITTYAGSVFCLDRRNGRKLWSRYLKRDAFRYESFYASPSTDGRRLYTIARSGRVYALSARTGKVLWKQRVQGLGYSTPAIGRGRVFVGGFSGGLRAFRSRDGRLLWRKDFGGGRILGPAVVIGRLVFFSTLEQRTYAVNTRNGRLVWQLRMGKYSPGIATERHYFFSLNGILIAFRARYSPR
jgi:outer membrane protein assembly factor BamB/O-antigen ligase